jgi:hypothetical protein
MKDTDVEPFNQRADNYESSFIGRNYHSTVQASVLEAAISATPSAKKTYWMLVVGQAPCFVWLH